MKRNVLSKLLLMSLCLSLVYPAVASADFTDIRNSDPDLQAIRYMEELEVFSGKMFEPNMLVTKTEVFEALLNSKNFDVTEEKTSKIFYNDVSPELLPYFSRMNKLGVLPNESGNAYPDQTLSLWRVLEYLFRYEGIPVQKTLVDTSYLDENVDNIFSGAWYAPLIDRALKMNLIDTKNRRLDVFGKVTRRDLAKILYNFETFENGLNGGKPIIRVESFPERSGIVAEDEFRILEDVWVRVNNDYIDADDVERDKLIYGAIDGLVESLDDPYSTFQLPTETTIKDNLSNEFEGIGASLSVLENGDIVIISPLKDSPAEKGGLLPGDIIVGVNDSSIRGKNLNEIVGLIKGPKDTEVIINVLRNGDELSFPITRGKISVEFVTGEMTYDNILVLDVRSFGAGTGSEIRKIVKSIEDTNIKGVVLDVRNNPGGFLEQAVEVANVFLEAGTSVVNVNYKNLDDEFLETTEDAPLSGLPVIVLVNKGSASASEIVAGALREKINAKIVGETTFGKGTVQQLIQYRDNSSLKLTTGEWTIPTNNGDKSIHKVGVIPNFEVKISDADREAGIDPQLNKAIQELR